MAVFFFSIHLHTFDRLICNKQNIFDFRNSLLNLMADDLDFMLLQSFYYIKSWVKMSVEIWKKIVVNTIFSPSTANPFVIVMMMLEHPKGWMVDHKSLKQKNWSTQFSVKSFSRNFFVKLISRKNILLSNCKFTSSFQNSELDDRWALLRTTPKEKSLNSNLANYWKIWIQFRYFFLHQTL